MNYKKLYNNLIETRKNRIMDTYYEKHHIIPKCMGGSNEEDNLIKLTFREHYMAHYILTKIYPNHSGIQYGFLCMLRKQPTGERILSSKQYDTIKRNFASYKSWYSKNVFNPGQSKKSREVARKKWIENNPNKGGATNHTSYPIRVFYNDGSYKDFEYMKQLTEKTGVPYVSVKLARRNGTPIKKYSIKKIIKLNGCHKEI